MPPDGGGRDDLDDLYHAAVRLLADSGEPAAVIGEISIDQFAAVYDGEGMNEFQTPVGDIFRLASDLAVFCVTLGATIGDEIKRRFSANDFAVASMLDAVASVAADTAADRVEAHFRSRLQEQGRLPGDTKVLRYSPGYCGWHISGQGRLFDFLTPERIGVSLTETFLMRPLKSISGVLIAAPLEVHAFRNNYGFCHYCESQGCRQRIRALQAG
jgi:hypothetical protein